MAASAEQLGLLPLAFWMVEQAVVQAPQDPSLHRILARLYEKQGDLAQAVSVWELVRRWAPDDSEAMHKIKDLSAKDTIVRGNYESSSHLLGRHIERKH